MPTRRKRTASEGSSRQAGVYIERSRVEVTGDLVGRDKIALGADDRELDKLFERLTAAIHDEPAVAPSQKSELAAAGAELKAELAKPEPDLGVLGRLKTTLSSHGGTIAAAAGAVFRYPPVQETVKALTQRLLGA